MADMGAGISGVYDPTSYIKTARLITSSVRKGSFTNPDSQQKQSSVDSASSDSEQDQGSEKGAYANIKLTGHYTTDLISSRETFGQNADVHIREFFIYGTDTPAAVMYVDGLVDQELVDDHLITPLMLRGVPELKQDAFIHPENAHLLKGYLKNHLLPVSQVEETESLQELALGVLSGKNALIIDGMPGALLIGSAKGKTRSIEEPLSEALLRGPRIGFTESLSDNTGYCEGMGVTRACSYRNMKLGHGSKRSGYCVYSRYCQPRDCS